MERGQATLVCVTGASGFIGSWLVMRLLERGYTVRATVRDPQNMEKVKHLVELPEAEAKLTLWKADLSVEGSFDEAIDGCHGVFHLATPMDFESHDPEKEIIKPTVDGVLNIVRSCAKAKTVRRLVFTSSAGAVTDFQSPRRPVYDETSWSNVQSLRANKPTGWMYFVSKTLAEKEAQRAAKENNIDFVSIIPTLVVGPFIMPTMPPSLITALSPILKGCEAHYAVIGQCQYVHLDDISNAHIFLFEHPQAEGRYICSSHDATIYDIVNLIRDKYPKFDVPTEFQGIDKNVELVRFSSKKLRDMGFEFKYSLEDMYVGAIGTCQDKGLIPRP